MKIAILHNYMDNIGGAEKVTLTLSEELNADIITTNVDYEAIRNMGFNNIKIKSIGRVPINAPFRQQLALYKFRKLNLKNKYDFFIICGDWAISGAVNNKPNLWYVHGPIREIWDLYGYTRKNSVPFLGRPVFDLWVIYNRYLNRKYVKNVNKIVCNSMNTQKRVKKYIKRGSVVINPPIETLKFHYKKTGDYWLSVNRLITHKRVDIQMKAFSKLINEKLMVVGCYEKSKHFMAYVKYIKKIKPKNVTLLRCVNSNQLIDLYANCKGFITTSKDEDFGMTPVEAMASGKPVIAVNEGGYKETIINGKTGYLICPKVNELVKAVKKILGKEKEFKGNCLKQAKKFSRRSFINKINTVIK